LPVSSFWPHNTAQLFRWDIYVLCLAMRLIGTVAAMLAANCLAQGLSVYKLPLNKQS
jgi:hypothetical protein